jgi:GMP reductase
MPTTYYSYADICLLPNFSAAHSRSDPICSPVVELGNRKFKVPVVPANMACTMNVNMARWMSANDYFYIMHRFNVDHSHPTNQDNYEFVKMANEEKWKTISISVGVQDEDKQFLRHLSVMGYMVDYITIDIAHAHSARMQEMLEYIRTLKFASTDSPYIVDGSRPWTSVKVSYKPFIIAGNVATPQGAMSLANWGADCVKVGIAQGDACTTYGQTGFGAPMFTCVQECAKSCPVPIIADGGVRMHGDIAKAIVAGAEMVMVGSIFAACKDSPADSIFDSAAQDEFIRKYKAYDELNKEFKDIIPPPIFIPVVTHKKYYGSASEHNKGTKHHIEGRMVLLPCNGTTYAEKLTEIEECLQSSISYSGGLLSSAKWGVINH